MKHASPLQEPNPKAERLGAWFAVPMHARKRNEALHKPRLETRTADGVLERS